MLSSILSDSLEFRSPTTTQLDKEYAAELGKLAGLDVHGHAEAMLEAKAQVDHLSPSELLMMDTKIFNIGGKKLRVSVLETTKPSAPMSKKAALVEAQKELVKKEQLDDVLFFVVDILKEEATFISASPSASKIVEKAWKVSVDRDGLVVLPGVLSRKKQMIPALEAAAPFEDPACNDKTGVCKAEAGKPHGGVLVNTIVTSEADRKKLISQISMTIELSERQACDVALLISGAFSPLMGFMKSADYEGVVSNMRTVDGTLFGLPVVLDVADASIQGKKVLLKYKGTDMAVLEAEEVWKPNKVKEAKGCYGTSSIEHPSVLELFQDLGKYYVGGKVHGLIQDFEAVWGKGFKMPAEVRATLPEGKPVVAFQNRNPVHKAHFELLVTAKNDVANSIVFVHPTCGPTQPGDIDGQTRIQTYEVMQKEEFYKRWAGESFRWAYLPYSMKMAGPREAIQHMIIRKNFGATHFIIGRDMAGTKSTLTSKDFYGAYDAQLMGEKHMGELNMNVAKYENMVYVGEEHGNERGYATESDAKKRNLKIAKLSGTEFRKRLRNGEEIPEWFAFPAVVKTLRDGGDAIFL
jgi:sulfate adenylyltransferase